MNRLRDWLSGLTRRERVLIGCGAGLIALLILYGVLRGVQRGMARREAAIVEARKNIEELKALGAEFRQIDATLKGVEAQITDSSLEKVMATVERIAAEEGLGDRLEGMKPKPVAGTDPNYEEMAVEMHLTKMDTESLVKFLFKIENAPGYIKVKKLRITGKGEPGSRILDAVIQVSTFTKKA